MGKILIAIVFFLQTLNLSHAQNTAVPFSQILKYFDSDLPSALTEAIASSCSSLTAGDDMVFVACEGFNIDIDLCEPYLNKYIFPENIDCSI